MRKVCKVSTREGRKHEEAMLAQAWRSMANKQTYGGGGNEESMTGGGEETSSNWSRKSSHKQKEEGLGTHTHLQRPQVP